MDEHIRKELINELSQRAWGNAVDALEASKEMGYEPTVTINMNEFIREATASLPAGIDPQEVLDEMNLVGARELLSSLPVLHYHLKRKSGGKIVETSPRTYDHIIRELNLAGRLS